MSAQANDLKNDYRPVSGKFDKPQFGGLSQILSKDAIRNKEEHSFPALDKYFQSRAANNIRTNKDSLDARSLVEIGDVHYKNKSFAHATGPYIKSLKIDPTNVDVYINLIQSFVALDKIRDADIFFNNLLKQVNRHPRYVSSYIGFRMKLMNTSDDDIKKTKQLSESAAKTNDPLLLNVAGLYNIVIENKVSIAKKLLQKALSIDPNNIDVNNNLGICFKLDNDSVNAEKYFSKAHYQDLKYIAAYENLASTYYMDHKIDKAIVILENAVDNHVILSNDWQHNLAMLYFQKSEFDEAIKIYKQLERKEPNNSYIPNNIGVSYLNTGKAEIGELYFSKAVLITKNNLKEKVPFDQRAVFGFTNLIQSYLDTDRDNEAKSLIDYAQRLFFNNSMLYHLEGMLQLRSGQYDDAKKSFEKSMRISPDAVEPAINLSFIMADIDFKYEETIDVLLKYATPDNLKNYKMLSNNLAYAYIKGNNLVEAKKYLSKDDVSYASLATKGLYYLLDGQVDNSKKYYDNAFKTASPSELKFTKQFYYLEHAEFYLQKGDKIKALKFAKKGLDYNASDAADKKLRGIIQSQRIKRG